MLKYIKILILKLEYFFFNQEQILKYIYVVLISNIIMNLKVIYKLIIKLNICNHTHILSKVKLYLKYIYNGYKIF